jgi:hypothetical protein
MESGRERAEANSAAKETPSSLVDTLKAGKGQDLHCDDSRQQDDIMSKQRDEDTEEGVQERMLKDESTAKITENAAEVRICSIFSTNLPIKPRSFVKSGLCKRNSR